MSSLVLFFVAMATHFVVNDHGLRADHRDRYDHIGRWVLASFVLVGFAVGSVTELSRVTYELIFAFLAGGVVLNVLKEELPEEQESRFGPFVAAVSGYGLLLLLIQPNNSADGN